MDPDNGEQHNASGEVIAALWLISIYCGLVTQQQSIYYKPSTNFKVLTIAKF